MGPALAAAVVAARKSGGDGLAAAKRKRGKIEKARNKLLSGSSGPLKNAT
jgi:hypothetical protein